MENQMVIFGVGSEYFGVEIAQVESIIKIQTITKLPHMPEFVKGVTNLRGKVLPIIDLRKRFGFVAEETDKHSRIIVVNLDQTEVGMIVDEVSEVLTVPEGAVEPTPEITTSVNSTFITGIAKLDPRLVILLNLQQVLSQREQANVASLATEVEAS
jgi:purine-binding chemotaxis protein CheW